MSNHTFPMPTLEERNAMAVTERVMSCLSVAGIMFIVLTYLFSSSFHKPINRLVFFASFGNLGMNVAALIAEDGPMSGADSALCQAQAFLVQMFLGVDAYWSLCMALNVYLIFFAHFNTKQLKKLDVRYIFCCYGLAFIPSLIFVFLDTNQGKVYGDAVLWCWIQDSWAVLRIALVYSVSWLAIAMALGVYALAALDVYKRRESLQPGFMNPFNNAPLKSVVTTEISVTVESRSKLALDGAPDPGLDTIDPFPGAVRSASAGPEAPHSYAVNVDAAQPKAGGGIGGMRTLTRAAAEYHANTEALLYARAAFFYFVALLIIWLPASINRAWAVAHPGSLSFPLNYLSCLLLSSQGLLNVVVYIITSREAVMGLVRGMGPRRDDRKWTSMDSEEGWDLASRELR